MGGVWGVCGVAGGERCGLCVGVCGVYVGGRCVGGGDLWGGMGVWVCVGWWCRCGGVWRGAFVHTMHRSLHTVGRPLFAAKGRVFQECCA